MLSEYALDARHGNVLSALVFVRSSCPFLFCVVCVLRPSRLDGGLCFAVVLHQVRREVVLHRVRGWRVLDFAPLSFFELLLSAVKKADQTNTLQNKPAEMLNHVPLWQAGEQRETRRGGTAVLWYLTKLLWSHSGIKHNTRRVPPEYILVPGHCKHTH